MGGQPDDLESDVMLQYFHPINLSARILTNLVKVIMELVVGSMIGALPAAKQCITIIEEDEEGIFLTFLLNTCQQWYQERDYALRDVGSSNVRYRAFVLFLKELYSELTRNEDKLQLETHEGVSPRLALQTLLIKCCQDCLKYPNTQAATDTLFCVLTSIAPDLEQELPEKLHELISNIRDAFLTSKACPAVKKTLLLLIELHASKWQLPASAVMYYVANE